MDSSTSKAYRSMTPMLRPSADTLFNPIIKEVSIDKHGAGRLWGLDKMIEPRSRAVLPVAFGCPRPQAKFTYLNIFSICRSIATSVPTRASSHFRRSDFTGQPFTGSYDAGERTSGPLGGASILGAPTLTPRTLKQHLDSFVVGQERAKKIMSVAVYNHYQRIQESQRQQDEEHALQKQQLRREMAESHPLESTSGTVVS